ncbi:MAG: cell division protein FtsZ [Bacteroidales bacterium]|jgi:cell division protein FtsZ|nr:cell division protein FtsZ [Bacteroidales bacterium]
MEDMIVPDGWDMSQSIIKVIGVGGGGCNAVSEMFRQGIKDVDFMICNTDIQSLKTSQVPETLRLGSDLTKGLGAGCDPEQGRKAATESIDDIRKSLQGNTEMVFITAGMGGGTGTGAAPVIAQVAKEMGKLTVAVVTLPFRDEGPEFIKRAVRGIRELKKHVDSLLIIDNQKLYNVFGELTIFDAFPRADEVLSTAVRSIADIINRPGFINVDFADVRMVMNNSGMAIMGMGEAEGPDRAIDAVQKALDSPLLNDCDLTTAKGVLVNITSSKEDGGLTMAELSQIMDQVRSYTGGAFNKFKRGVVYDPSIGKKISVTIVATGFEISNLPQIDMDDDNDGPIPLEPGAIWDDEPEDTPEQEFAQPENTLKQVYVKPEGKPALILDPGDDINELERVPAYVRRNKKLSGIMTDF